MCEGVHVHLILIVTSWFSVWFSPYVLKWWNMLFRRFSFSYLFFGKNVSGGTFLCSTPGCSASWSNCFDPSVFQKYSHFLRVLLLFESSFRSNFSAGFLFGNFANLFTGNNGYKNFSELFIFTSPKLFFAIFHNNFERKWKKKPGRKLRTTRRTFFSESTEKKGEKKIRNSKQVFRLDKL